MIADTSQLLTLRDDPIHHDLVLENVSSIPVLQAQGSRLQLLSHPTTNRAAAGLHFKHQIVTPSSLVSSSQPTVKSNTSSGMQPVQMNKTRSQLLGVLPKYDQAMSMIGASPERRRRV